MQPLTVFVNTISDICIAGVTVYFMSTKLRLNAKSYLESSSDLLK